MRRKGIGTIFLCSFMIFALLSGAFNVGSTITTDSHLKVVNTGVEGMHPIVDGDIIVFRAYHHWEDPAYVYYHDTTTRTTYSTGIEGYHWGVDIPYIMIWSPEWTFGDVNGDGDENDVLYHYYDINTKTSTVFAEGARIVWPSMDNGKIVYSLSEVSDKIDYNGDGILKDSCGFYYDVTTGKSTYFADALFVNIYGNYIIWDRFGALWYLDVTIGTPINVGLDSQYPHANLWFWKCDKDIIAFQIDEGAYWGEDLNGDGDTFDIFSGYYDISTGTLKIITDIENRLADVSDGKILIYTSSYPHKYYLYDTETNTLIELKDYEGSLSNMEGNIVVGNEWNGPVVPSAPPPVGVPNVLIYDTTTQKLTNTSIIGSLDQWQGNFDGDIIAIVTYEANVPEDLNGDGDTNDHIVRYIIDAPPLEATIDIDPDTLNLKSKGRWITCYIELPEGFDVNDIEELTILLEDTISAEPRPVTVGDYDKDGIPDLMVKFERSKVEEMLLPGIYNLKISGQLTDGTLFEGYSDTIKVIDPP